MYSIQYKAIKTYPLSLPLNPTTDSSFQISVSSDNGAKFKNENIKQHL